MSAPVIGGTSPADGTAASSPGSGSPGSPVGGQPHRLVLASAGTGKTYRLTVEYLRRVFLGASPDSLLATTFTRKAAGEILERILVRIAAATLEVEQAKSLARDVGEPSLTQHDFGRFSRLIADRLHRLSVSTLDAFFHRILSSFRFELGIPASPHLAAPNDPRVERLRSQALERVLEDLMEEDFDELLSLLDRLHDERARRSVAWELDRVFLELYEIYRQAPQPEIWSQMELRPTLDGSVLDQKLETLHLLLREEPLKKSIAQALELELGCAERGAWRMLLDRGIGKKLSVAPGEPLDPFYRGLRIPDVVVRSYLPVVQHAESVLLNRLAERTRAMFDVLARYSEHFERLRKEQRIVLFSDLAFRLCHELPSLEPERLYQIYYRLDRQVEHLLLDEFQDTSLEQWQVIETFADEILATGDGSRSFFCVGDPKQAIYGWRGGCPELFAVVEQRLSQRGMSAETLTVNYRSSPVVLDAVNRVFQSIPLFPRYDDLQDVVERWCVAFEPHSSHDPSRPGHVRLLASRSFEPEIEDRPDSGDGEGGAESSERPDVYIETLVDTVVEIDRQVRPSLSSSGPIASVGVLVRTNRMVGFVLDALRRRGLEASGEGGSPVVDDPLVTLILSGLVLADHPGDTAALFHLEHSPLADVLGLSEERDVLAASRRIRARLAAEGLATVVGDWARQLSGHGNRRSAARLVQLLDLAETFEGASSARPMDFVQFAIGATVEDPTPAGIRVMTVHRSKGLEFDAVVLGELESSRARGSDLTVWVEREDPTSQAGAVFRATRKSLRRLDSRLDRAHRQEVERRMWDDLSTLYVAMTRARYALHMVIKSKKPVKNRQERWADSHADVLTFALNGSPIPEESHTVLFEQGDESWARALRGDSGVSPDQGAESVPEGRSRAAGETGPGRRDGLRAEPREPETREPETGKPEAGKPEAGESCPRGSRGAGFRGRGLPIVQPSSVQGDAKTVDVQQLLRVEPQRELLRGSVLHDWLSTIEWLDETAADSGLPDRDLLERRARVVAPQARPAWIDDWLEQFERILAQPTVRARFAKPERRRRGERVEVWRERDFALIKGGELWRGRFDRVVVHRRGSSFVGAELVDFKSETTPEPDLGDELGYGPLRERYRQQLAAYRESLASILGLLEPAVHASILFLDSGDELTLE